MDLYSIATRMEINMQNTTTVFDGVEKEQIKRTLQFFLFQNVYFKDVLDTWILF